jgi:hypothetical protein
MISDKNKDRVALICYATVSHAFARHLRHTGYDWNIFPKMMADQCKDQVILAQIRGRDMRDTDAIYAHTENTGREIATRLITDAGIK